MRSGDAGAAARGTGAAGDRSAATIVLLAGTVKVPDRLGHHDYLAGCALLAFLLEQTAGLRAIVVRDGWPEDERVLDGARALVFYSGGARKLAFLRSPRRVDCLQRAIDRGVGVVMVHQAVSYRRGLAPRRTGWLGGAQLPGKRRRGPGTTNNGDWPALRWRGGAEDGRSATVG